MTEIFLDIETFGMKPEARGVVLPTEADVKLGNLKDPEKIKEKIKESLPILIAEAEAKAAQDFDNEWRGGALKSTKGYIIALSFAMDNNPVVNLFTANPEEEYVILDQFNSELKKFAPLHKECYVVAHNGLSFDFPWLKHRAIKYGFRLIFELLNLSRYDPRAKDTMDMFRGSDFKQYYSLDGIARFLGIPGKNIMNGAQVHDYFLAGEIEKIAEYCGSDVEVLRNVYRRLTRFNI